MRNVLQPTAVLLVVAIASLLPAGAQQFGGPPASMFGGASEQYTSKCAGCHGDTLAGGRGPSLFSEALLAETTDASLTNSILNGRLQAGMPAFKDQLSESDVNQLIAYLRIRSQAHLQAQRRKTGWNWSRIALLVGLFVFWMGLFFIASLVVGELPIG